MSFDKNRYTLPGVINYLTSEFTNLERYKITANLERSEMKFRIVQLQGEVNALKVINERQAAKIKELTQNTTNTTETELDLPDVDLDVIRRSRQQLTRSMKEIANLLKVPAARNVDYMGLPSVDDNYNDLDELLNGQDMDEQFVFNDDLYKPVAQYFKSDIEPETFDFGDYKKDWTEYGKSEKGPHQKEREKERDQRERVDTDTEDTDDQREREETDTDQTDIEDARDDERGVSVENSEGINTEESSVANIKNTEGSVANIKNSEGSVAKNTERNTETKINTNERERESESAEVTNESTNSTNSTNKSNEFNESTNSTNSTNKSDESTNDGESNSGPVPFDSSIEDMIQEELRKQQENVEDAVEDGEISDTPTFSGRRKSVTFDRSAIAKSLRDEIASQRPPSPQLSVRYSNDTVVLRLDESGSGLVETSVDGVSSSHSVQLTNIAPEKLVDVALLPQTSHNEFVAVQSDGSVYAIVNGSEQQISGPTSLKYPVVRSALTETPNGYMIVMESVEGGYRSRVYSLTRDRVSFEMHEVGHYTGGYLRRMGGEGEVRFGGWRGGEVVFLVGEKEVVVENRAK